MMVLPLHIPSRETRSAGCVQPTPAVRRPLLSWQRVFASAVLPAVFSIWSSLVCAAGAQSANPYERPLSSYSTYELQDVVRYYFAVENYKVLESAFQELESRDPQDRVLTLYRQMRATAVRAAGKKRPMSARSDMLTSNLLMLAPRTSESPTTSVLAAAIPDAGTEPTSRLVAPVPPVPESAQAAGVAAQATPAPATSPAAPPPAAGQGKAKEIVEAVPGGWTTIGTGGVVLLILILLVLSRRKRRSAEEAAQVVQAPPPSPEGKAPVEAAEVREAPAGPRLADIAFHMDERPEQKTDTLGFAVFDRSEEQPGKGAGDSAYIPPAHRDSPDSLSLFDTQEQCPAEDINLANIGLEDTEPPPGPADSGEPPLRFDFAPTEEPQPSPGDLESPLDFSVGGPESQKDANTFFHSADDTQTVVFPEDSPFMSDSETQAHGGAPPAGPSSGKEPADLLDADTFFGSAEDTRTHLPKPPEKDKGEK